MQRATQVAVLLYVLSLLLLAVSAAAQAESCAADFKPTLGADGLVYLNPCVAKAQGAVIIKSSRGQRATGARPVTAGDMSAHSADSFRFIDFARVRRIKATLQGSSSAVGAPSLKQLPKDRVVLFDVARGAIYASAAPAAMPEFPAAAVSTPAAQGQPGDMFAQQQASPSPAPSSEQQPPEMLTPEIKVDLPNLKSRSPSPSPEPSPSPSPEPSPSPSPEPSSGGGGGGSSRKLRFVQAADERRDISEQPTGVPLAAVGQLLSYGQEWHCSAALIGERTIVTAAHCVYDRSTGAFARGLYFVPGRFRDAAGAVRAPYGAFDVSEVYVSSQFVSGEPQDIWDVDLAVVRLQRNVQVGKVLGYFGVSVPAVVAASTKPAPAITAAADVAAAGDAAAAAAAGADVAEIKATTATGSQSMTMAAANRRTLRPGRQQQPGGRTWQGQLGTAGYPSDREEGTLVSTQCQAEQALSSAAGGTIKLTGCSTHLGQSGSALYNKQGQMRGVVSFEIIGSEGYNGGTAITHYLYTNLVRPYIV